MKLNIANLCYIALGIIAGLLVPFPYYIIFAIIGAVVITLFIDFN
jgi:hypothetical protein